MAPLFRDVSPSELAVLQTLWERGESRIGELAHQLYPGGGAAHYSTVQRLLDRLEEKGFVARDRSGRAHVFRASVQRPDFLSRRLRELSERLCAGSHLPLLSQLVRSKALSAGERAELRRLLDETEGEVAP